ncbi:MAG: hypothetical protein KOO60_06490 [Gemmatimonadales bacterium]|nr:hypothetical protein [Gemmatimonadales bacterium]
MTLTIFTGAERSGRPIFGWVFACFLLLVVCLPVSSSAKSDEDLYRGIDPSGLRVMDGSFVMNVGEVQIHITNWGLIGTGLNANFPWGSAPSCQWPAGSGNEYLWAAGLMVGGVVLGERLVTTRNEVAPLDNDVQATIYEAVGTTILRPPGNSEAGGKRAPSPGPDDDDDGLIDEEILNGADDDGDGLIDEDFGQIGNQMFVCTMYDNTPMIKEQNAEHKPLNLEIVQSTYQWENDQVDDFVGFEYQITNVGVADIERVYIGFNADADIGPSQGDTAGDDAAGSWRGAVRASDGSFVPVEVGYMFDVAENDPVDGYFGIVFLGHDIDPTGQRAPTKVGMRTFQSFQGQMSFDQGGDPTNDDERYQLLSALPEEWDGNTAVNRANDFRFLVSAGPFEVLEKDETLNFQVAIVMGPGLGSPEGGEGLLANCAQAAQTWYGIFVNEVPNMVALSGGGEIITGHLGRETMLCKEDFHGSDAWEFFAPDFMDTSCVDAEWLMARRITPEDEFEFTFPDGESKTCAMFNMDNCFECIRQLGPASQFGIACGPLDFEEGNWECNNPNAASFSGCTGIDGEETQIHWLVGMAPPPPLGLRMWPTDGRVHIFWDDNSENVKDIRLQTIDFESYRIWRADNWDRPFGSSIVNGPESDLWKLIAEYDLINSFVSYRDLMDADGNPYVHLDTIPLGMNTGLGPIVYTPRCLADTRYAGLQDAMQVIVDSDLNNDLRERPAIRLTDGSINPKYRGLVYWESYPTVLDTFFWVASREADLVKRILPKRSTRFYEYVDTDVHNGFLYFYSVTASDHGLLPPENSYDIDLPVGSGLIGDPGSSFTYTVPGTRAQTVEERALSGANIYVFPNPATRAALEEFQQMDPNGDDPTGVRVSFSNLPMAHNTIKIFTVSGDLVQTIVHDGTAGVGHTSWNLMSRSGQEIVSGIYLYSVQTADSGFEDFIGKFVVIR